MTETREQWIEREARKARERYWGSIGDWDEDGESIRQDWRNVVAPYYQPAVALTALTITRDEINSPTFGQPSPLRVPVDVDGLAEVIEKAYWDDDKGWRDVARAALAYINIDPCAKPEYDPDDVALTPNERAELENLRAECKRLRDCETELLERREEQAQLFNEAKGYKERCARLKNELNIRQEKYECVMARHKALAGEMLAIKQANTQQPVKVWFDVTAEEFAGRMSPAVGANVSPIIAKNVMRLAAAHAVLEVPPGAPSVKDIIDVLREHIGWYEGTEKEEDEIETIVLTGYDSAATAIQDAILAAMPQRREWTEQDVEGLRKVIKGTYWNGGTTKTAARAALAWFDGKRGG